MALVRIEQLYPFPEEEVLGRLQPCHRLRLVSGRAAEPGRLVRPPHHYDSVLPSHARLRYAGRPASASPAVGYMSVHAKQQKASV
ncbi:hypothetical protein ACLK2G_03890 [Escherichia coli]